MEIDAQGFAIVRSGPRELYRFRDSPGWTERYPLGPVHVDYIINGVTFTDVLPSHSKLVELWNKAHAV
jgi:hypothetical protein